MPVKNRLKEVQPAYAFTTLTQAQIDRAKKSDLDPLTLLFAVMRMEELPLATRLDAAKAAIPYTHQKKPLAVEGTNKPLIFGSAELRDLSGQELLLLKTLLDKAGVTLEDPSVRSH